MMSEVAFKKHVYGRQVKHTLQSLATFDPRPSEYHGTAPEQMNDFLKKVKGKGLGVSVLLDKDARVWRDSNVFDEESSVPVPATDAHIPSQTELTERVAAFKQALELSPEQIRELERNTREQHLSELWYSARRYRLTASTFGRILQLQPTTPPDSLVKQLLHSKPFSTNATEWGKENEPKALQEYVKNQLSTGHTDLVTCSAGFVVSEEHPFLGASPDAYVFDPSSPNQFGLVEVKCPYKYRDLHPEDAAQQTDFCCKLSADKVVELKRKHQYFAQVQGQLAITERKWCDFVIYTKKGVSIERIEYDSEFWENQLLPKLITFYDCCFCPSIVSPIHFIGKKVHDLRLQSS